MSPAAMVPPPPRPGRLPDAGHSASAPVFGRPGNPP